MARPRKNDADYFPHDNDMRNNLKVRAVRQRHGLEGYAVWCMLIETLTGRDNFTIEVDELTVEMLAGDYGVPAESLQSMLESFRRLKLINPEPERIFAPGLLERMEPLMADRQRKREWAERNSWKKPVENLDSGTNRQQKHSENEFSTSKTPQSKVKESKVKESKESESVHTHAQAVEVEVLQPLPSPAMHEFVNAQTPDELESKILKFYTGWPNLKEWIESTTVAGQMGPQDRTDVVRGFCSYAIEKGYGRKTYQDLHARFSKWWQDQKNFNRASVNGKPANGQQNGLKFNSPDTISDALDFAARWQRETELGLPH